MSRCNENDIKTTSYLAVAAGLCGLAAIASQIMFVLCVATGMHCGLFVTGSIWFCHGAFFLGITSLAVIAIRNKQSKGYLYAIFAIVVSVPFLSVFYAVGSVSRTRREREKTWTGQYNLRLLGKQLIEYAQDNADYLPTADQWCELLMEHNTKLTRDNFVHPKPHWYHLKGECHFAFNKNLSGMRLSDIPGNVVLVFEADGDWNLSGTSELLKTRYREKGYITIMYVNGDTADYWFYMKAVRKFDRSGKMMYYEQPRWEP
ncbi:MAG: hypothetical protein ACYS76_01410 [Planctomycetota bacterium]|jgi:hypothetical protein